MKILRASSIALALAPATVSAQASRAIETLSGEPTSSLAIGLWVCTAIAIIVFGAMIYSVVAFRSSGTHAPNKALELVWALVPIVIVVAAASPAMQNATPEQNHRLAGRVADNRIDHNIIDQCVAMLTAAKGLNAVRAIAPEPCTPQR